MRAFVGVAKLSACEAVGEDGARAVFGLRHGGGHRDNDWAGLIRRPLALRGSGRYGPSEDELWLQVRQHDSARRVGIEGTPSKEALCAQLVARGGGDGLSLKVDDDGTASEASSAPQVVR